MYEYDYTHLDFKWNPTYSYWTPLDLNLYLTIDLKGNWKVWCKVQVGGGILNMACGSTRVMQQ